MKQDTLVTFIESVRDGVFVVDRNNHIISCNNSAAVMLGKTASALLGQNFFDAVEFQHNASVPSDADSPLTKTRLSGVVYVSESEQKTFTMSRADRTLLTVSISVIPDEDGKLIIIFHDTTADQKVDRAKSEFISLVSHQLRTPVNIISWYIEKLLAERKGDLNDTQRNYLREIESSNKRLIDLVRSIVNVSRTDLARLKLKHEPANIEELAAKAMHELEELSNLRAVTIGLETHIDNVIIQDSDQELVLAIIRTVLHNAVIYSPKGSTVKITLDLASKTLISKKGIIVSVADQGIGIPDEEKSMIFSKLYRASNVQALDVTGIGLGLYVASHFVHVLGGKLWFESTVHKGSIFYIYLPDKE